MTPVVVDSTSVCMRAEREHLGVARMWFAQSWASTPLLPTAVAEPATSGRPLWGADGEPTRSSRCPTPGRAPRGCGGESAWPPRPASRSAGARLVYGQRRAVGCRATGGAGIAVAMSTMSGVSRAAGDDLRARRRGLARRSEPVMAIESLSQHPHGGRAAAGVDRPQSARSVPSRWTSRSHGSCLARGPRPRRRRARQRCTASPARSHRSLTLSRRGRGRPPGGPVVSRRPSGSIRVRAASSSTIISIRRVASGRPRPGSRCRDLVGATPPRSSGPAPVQPKITLLVAGCGAAGVGPG